MGDQKVLLVQNGTVAGGVTKSWTVPEDCFLISAGSFRGDAVVSRDPSITSANFTVPTADFVGEKFAFLLSQQTGSYRIFLKTGTKLYIALSNKDSASLILELPDIVS